MYKLPLLLTCIFCYAAFFIRMIYEINQNAKITLIEKQIQITAKYLNIEIYDIKTYLNYGFIRYSLLANSYKNITFMITLLEYNIKKKCILEIDYNYCYIDIYDTSIQNANIQILNSRNCLNFITGCHKPISINLLQNIIIIYNNDNCIEKIIKYIQNIIVHIQLIIFTTMEWNTLLTNLYIIIHDRLNVIWQHAADFNQYSKFFDDIKPIIIVYKMLFNHQIPPHLLILMNRAGVYLLCLSKYTNNNINNIFDVSLEACNQNELLINIENFSQFILIKNDYKFHVYSHVL